MAKSSLTIIIVSYNTKDLLEKCLTSIIKAKITYPYEIIVSDNGSKDGSRELVKAQFKEVRLLVSSQNLGFAGGNNRAKNYVNSTYVLFLNSDTLVNADSVNKSVGYLDKHPKVGLVSCKTLLPDGSLDKDCRRSFPTPWAAFSHLVIPLDRLFPNSKIFSRYWYGYINPDLEHEIDVAQGAFMLTRKVVLDKMGWFDEDYFMDGEDVDLCWRIKNDGWKIVYYPKIFIVHYKKASKKSKILSRKDRLRSRMASVNSMETFYKKHLWQKYNILVNSVVSLGIYLIKLQRLLSVLIVK
ncbi:hypothetical protein A3D84_00680 [Candidatus Woesebacteria bacterium RIFCSPHIGHO2_02_FULL_42_20]|uniref:Glycosyltransferase 2-like domain-containing protein n=1 Tax=Candidatus Woesebacteria bacterium RIFCSPHIGHO2_12_FULL_41_24 TaxID=1802510 RepID=A0A1F8APY4_9BACT|nr:MAG: hypothetical protein A2W15_04905 [Candidatus Woesebacteria bacterium RBG_16_41_13]OGM30637.1 MAG: hypothetical protein A2873_00800 [Candidatus Woesebacteria bacterium RIFCSPHIGHO2_01_FULL_42_80]OGM35774.1 MAG: hypothetical protein A3D84_00680 [Candidatus Woesebacteria bacterium RIFCSPHIGHO2_02_FULL_42_20]OGM53833.1 MAG: hypothetical protein A3E44_05450 [Candidatus Woesebacteria bacterium RIFCSPHIGHO2_12_FULL_41_24]OGM66025.1 MAG: hypothetical protein A2969_03545 [Candidatus Woesebacteri